jgi:hypothetical protein
MDAAVSQIFSNAAAAEGLTPPKGKGKGNVRGRRDKQTKQEAVIKLDALSGAVIGTLVADYRHAHEASETFNDGIKAQAEKAGIQSPVLRAFIIARAGDKFEDRKRDAQQLNLLFENIGG